MTDTEALTRRDDELLMGDEGLGSGAPQPSSGSPEPEPEAMPRCVTHDELPRDGRGVVVGAWHVTECPETHVSMLERTGYLDPYLYGHEVDRAVAFGCRVAPGTRPPE